MRSTGLGPRLGLLYRQPWFGACSTRIATRRHTGSLAYIEGPKTPPLLGQTIPEHFDSIVSRYADRIAVVSSHQGVRLSFRDLQAQSNSIAWGLRGLGVRKGDRVAVSMGNCIEYAIVTYSLYRLGAILVPLNPAFTSAQVISALNHLTASHLIIGAETRLSRRPPTSNTPLFRSLLSEPSPVQSLRTIVVADNSSSTTSFSPPSSSSFSSDTRPSDLGPQLVPFSALQSRLNLDEAAPPRPDSALVPEDPINIQFTSGTTSAPKAAVLTHASLLNNGRSIGERLRLTADDAVCCPPPLFHCFGSVLGYMATATHGARIVFPAPAFDPAATLDAVRAERCSALYGVPTMFAAVLDLLAAQKRQQQQAEQDSGRLAADSVDASAGLDRLRTGIAAGSSVPEQMMRRLHDEMGLRELCICYGMTETSPVSAMTSPDDPLRMRLETCGRLLPHVRAKVVDPAHRSSGRVLPFGTRGELAVSGYLVMKGYWGDEAKTEEAISRDEEGRVWMHTGDEASISEDGYVSITGRLKDLIIRGGENIHPLEVENCILAHGSVSDVSVVGVPDEHYGEVVGAFVIPKSGHESGLGVEDVRDWVRSRLSSHLVPKFVFFTDAFPKTASGKVQKFALRETAAKLLEEHGATS